MAVIFSTEPGRVLAFNDNVVTAEFAAHRSVQLEGWHDTGGFNRWRSIITSIGVGQQGNYQFLHTLGKYIFVYVFGDRIGSLTLSGMSFPGDCDTSSTTPMSGIERVMDYYRVNRLARRGAILRVTLGLRTTFAAMLIGINSSVSDPQTNVHQFQLSMALIPTDDF